MQRWLAVYRNDAGVSRAAMISAPPNRLPFGVMAEELNLPEYNDGGGLTLVEMPRDPDFRPDIIDVGEDEEAPLHFVDL